MQSRLELEKTELERLKLNLASSYGHIEKTRKEKQLEIDRYQLAAQATQHHEHNDYFVDKVTALKKSFEANYSKPTDEVSSIIERKKVIADQEALIAELKDAMELGDIMKFQAILSVYNSYHQPY